MKLGGAVLCGGKSSRMGRPKGLLPWENEVLLQKIVRTVQQVCSPVVLVAAKDQEVPHVSKDVKILRDEVEGKGPLAGLVVALKKMASEVDAVFLASCDVPFLDEATIRFLAARLDGHRALVPRVLDTCNPLVAIYRVDLLRDLGEMLEKNCLRMQSIAEIDGVLILEEEEFVKAGQSLMAFRNINTPQEYEEALKNVKKVDP